MNSISCKIKTSISTHKLTKAYTDCIYKKNSMLVSSEPSRITKPRNGVTKSISSDRASKTCTHAHKTWNILFRGAARLINIGESDNALQSSYEWIFSSTLYVTLF